MGRLENLRPTLVVDDEAILGRLLGTRDLTLRKTYKKLFKMAIEIVDLPWFTYEKWWSSSSLCKGLPEGNRHPVAIFQQSVSRRSSERPNLEPKQTVCWIFLMTPWKQSASRVCYRISQVAIFFAYFWLLELWIQHMVVDVWTGLLRMFYQVLSGTNWPFRNRPHRRWKVPCLRQGPTWGCQRVWPWYGIVMKKHIPHQYNIISQFLVDKITFFL